MQRFEIEGQGALASWAVVGAVLLIACWYAGGYLFAFAIGVLAGLIIAYRIVHEYLAGWLGR